MPEPQPLSEISLFLYDFAPFLSVAIAINFVSSFWGQLKNKSINNLDRNINDLVSDLNAVYTSGDCERSDSVESFKEEAQGYKKKLNRMSKISTFLGVVIVFGLFFLLALIGFKPKFEISFYEAISMLILSVVPSAAFRFCGIHFSGKYVTELKKTSNTIKIAAKSAVDNEKSAYSNSKNQPH
uniref:hypothetical protein n=1 Tax=Vibrio tasmaniensis TaxID=212663 RepID=UPI00107F322A